MRKKIYIALMAIAMMVLMTSCENKVDSLLDQYEAAVDEYVAEVQKDQKNDASMFDNLNAAAKLSAKVDDVVAELNKYADKMTGEQKARMLEINMKMAEGTTQNIYDIMEDAQSFSKDMEKMFPTGGTDE